MYLIGQSTCAAWPKQDRVCEIFQRGHPIHTEVMNLKTDPIPLMASTDPGHNVLLLV